MLKSSDFTLIGGGIVGLLTARELARNGASVTILEQSEIGRESSWAGGGILLPLYPWRQPEAISRLVIPSVSAYPQLADELHSRTSIDPEWTRCGLLITRNEDMKAAHDWCLRFSIEHEDAETSDLQGLQGDFVSPLLLPGIAQIRNPRLVKSLKQDLLQSGVTLLEHCQTNRIETQHNRVVSVATGHGEFAVNELIVTAGAWTSHFLESCLGGETLPDTTKIVPVKGQMLLFAAQPDTLGRIVLDGDHYLIPRRDGHILAGSTVEYGTFDKTPTREALDEISAFAYNLFPALKKFPVVKHWSGIRPGSPDGIPWIGRHPLLTNLSINAGHFRNGLSMAPASAKLMADILLKRTPSIDPEPLSLATCALKPLLILLFCR